MSSILNDATLGALTFDHGCAEVVVAVLGRPVELDVNFDEGEIDGGPLAALGPTLCDLDALNSRAREALLRDLTSDDEDGAARLYRSHHFEELDPGALERIFGTADTGVLTDARFLAAFVLQRIGVYPNDGEAAILCDYGVGTTDDTSYLLSVAFDARGKAAGVSMES